MVKAATRFGSYILHHELGRGGMGEVYEAEHEGLGKRVALKVLRHGASEEANERFVREGRATARIRHEHVVDVTDVGVVEGVAFLVMELLQGESLAARIAREGPLRSEQIAALMLPVLSAVTAAHEAGVLHRDLKPANIFLACSRRGESVPKVLDFGVASVDALDGDAERLTGSRCIVGTPGYLAPEAVHGSRHAGPAADQYSLGVVMFECATRQLPFAATSLFGLLSAIRRGRVRAPSTLCAEVDPRLDAIILRAMQREPQDRFASLHEMAAALLPLASADVRARWQPELSPRVTPGSTLDARGLTRTIVRPAWRRAPAVVLACLAALLGASLVRRDHGVRALPDARSESPPTVVTTPRSPVTPIALAAAPARVMVPGDAPGRAPSAPARAPTRRATPAPHRVAPPLAVTTDSAIAPERASAPTNAWSLRTRF